MRDRCQLLIPKEQQLQQPSNIGTGKSIQPQRKQFISRKLKRWEMQRALLPCPGIPLTAWMGERKGKVSAHMAFTWQKQLVLSLSFNIVFPELRGRGRRGTSSSLTWVTQWDLLSKNNKPARYSARLWPQPSQAGAGGSLQAPGQTGLHLEVLCNEMKARSWSNSSLPCQHLKHPHFGKAYVWHLQYISW